MHLPQLSSGSSAKRLAATAPLRADAVGAASDAAVVPALVPAVVRAAALLDALARQRQPMSMARLSAELALPRSSVHGLCNTLLQLGYLRRQTDGQMLIGPRVMSLAEAFVSSTDAAREFDALWQGQPQPVDETVVLSVLDGADVVYLAVRSSARPLGLAFTVGMRLPAHVTATGKAMLAWLPTDQLSGLLPQGPLPRITHRGPRSRRALQAELATCRAQGCAVDDEGVRLGVYAVAAPVFDASGRAVAAISVCINKALLDQGGEALRRQHVLALSAALTQRLGGVAASAAKPTQPPRR